MTSRKKITWLAIPVLAIAFLMTSVGDPQQADAGGFSLHIGGYGGGYGGGYRSYRSYRPQYYGRAYRAPVYNYHRSYSAPHLDYHGPSLVPHGNHLDYVPGHYDVHYGSHHGYGGHYYHH